MILADILEGLLELITNIFTFIIFLIRLGRFNIGVLVITYIDNSNSIIAIRFIRFTCILDL